MFSSPLYGKPAMCYLSLIHKKIIFLRVFVCTTKAQSLVTVTIYFPLCDNTGKAFVIFKSKLAAEAAISKLTRNCLILSDGRYLELVFSLEREKCFFSAGEGSLTSGGNCPDLSHVIFFSFVDK